jgi:hypothetical protein
VHTLTVVLQRDNRSDDVQGLIDAISMFKGVASVKMHVTDLTAHMAQERARMDMRKKIYAALEDSTG